MQRYFENPADRDAQAQLQSWIESYQTYRDYDQVRLLDGQSTTRLAVPNDLPPLSSTVARRIPEVLQSGQVTFVDFYRCEVDQNIHLDLLIPLVDRQADGRVIGFVDLRIDPERYLFPFVQSWPTSSQSAETMLVRQDGDRMQYLNNLRFRENAALNLELSLKESRYKAIESVMGETDILEGIDYRGVKVVADVRAVDGSSWFLATKIDAAEVYAPLRERLWLTILIFGLLIATAGTGLGFIWRQQRLRYYRGRVEAAEALRKSETNLSALIENTDGNIWAIDRHYRLVAANKTFYSLITSLSGRLLKIGDSTFPSNLPPEMVAEWQGYYDRVLQGEVFSIEVLTWLLPELHYIEYRFNPIRNEHGEISGATIFGRDITESKQAEEKLRLRLSELEVLYESSLDISLIQPPQELAQKIVATLKRKLNWHHIVIRAFAPETRRLRLLALSHQNLDPDELANEIPRLEQLIPDPEVGLSGWVIKHGKPIRCGNVQQDPHYRAAYPDIHSGLYVPIRAGEHILGEITVEDARLDAFTEDDERLLVVLATQAAIGMENSRLYQEVQKELSERLKIEAELVTHRDRLEELVQQRTQELEARKLALEKSENELRQAVQAADAANRAKSDFLAVMSHEIRTPMNAVMGLTHLALNTNLTQQQYDYLAKIQASAQNLLKIINNILDFSKIEAGKVVLETTPFNLDNVLDQLAMLINAQLKEKPIEIFFCTASDIPRSLIGDPLRLLQVLNNLGDNALKFTEAGEIVVAIQLSDRTPTAVTLEFSMRDTGIGIAPDKISDIFNVFTQADTSTTRRYGGTGLGLSISKRLVEIMGGELSVKSLPGKGSVFAFSVCFQIDRPEMPQLVDSEYSQVSVLMMDENPTGQKCTGNSLLPLVKRLTFATSGEQTLQVLDEASATDPYDLLILNGNLSGEAGSGLLQQIQAFAGVHPKPAILVTSRLADRQRWDGMPGIDGWLVRPFSQTALLRAISLAMHKELQSESVTSHTPNGLTGNTGVVNLRRSATDSIISESAGSDETLPGQKAVSELSSQELSVLERLFQELASQLKSNDLEAVDVLETLQNHLRLWNLKLETRPLERYITEYDFEKALQYLARLANALHLPIKDVYE